MKIGIFWKFCQFRSRFADFFLRLFLRKHLLDNLFSVLSVFNILSNEEYQKFDKIIVERKINWKIEQYWQFWMSIWGHSRVFEVKQKIFKKTYRMKPNGRIMGGN